jgi:hypothetical protein
VLSEGCGSVTALSSRQKKGYPKNDEYYTPKSVFDHLGITFDLDPCSPLEGSNVPAKQTYSLPLDGLKAPWFGLVWMNPPYSEMTPWVNKFMDHGNGVALLPTAQSKWFSRVWAEADGICLLPIPFKFDRPEGMRKTIFFPVALVAMGDVSYQALLASNLGRVR